MSAPLTQTQIPNDSILDIEGRQTYLGNSFVLPMPGKAIAMASSTETPIAVISNPLGSGKSLFMYKRNYSTDLNLALTKLYLNPTVNVHGTATIAQNLRSRSTTSSVSNCYLAPTITSNGTFLERFSVSYFPCYSDFLIVIDPGDSLLVTTTNLGFGDIVALIEFTWYEI